MFWLDLLITFMFMLLIAIIRMLFKVNKQIGRLEENQRLNQARLGKIEGEIDEISNIKK